ncbi:MAG: HAD hydrolase-like protein [Candidatus Aenigmatarchaeota archaeon]
MIFDLGETLVSLDSCERNAIQSVARRLRSMGYSTDFEQIRNSKSKNKNKIKRLKERHVERWLLFDVILRDMGLKLKNSETREISNLYDESYIKSSKLKPYAVYALKRARKEGKKVALLSDGWNKVSRGILEHHGLKNYFDFIFTSEDLEKTKLNGAFGDFCDLTGFLPKECLVIGNDEEKDGISTKLGMYFCCFGGRGEFSINSLKEVDGIFKFFRKDITKKCFFCDSVVLNSMFCKKCSPDAEKIIRESDRKGGLLTDLDDYLGRDTIEEVLNGPLLLREEWFKANPRKEREVINFYRKSEAQIFDLTLFHSAPHVMKQDKEIKTIIKDKGGKFIDFGAGIGHLTVSVSLLGLRTFHSDLKGKTMDYALWRSKRHGTKINFVDVKFNTKFDSIVCTDVLEHHTNPIGLLRFLEKRLNKKGLLIVNGKFQGEKGIDYLRPMHLLSNYGMTVPLIVKEVSKNLKIVSTLNDGLYVLQKR